MVVALELNKVAVRILSYNIRNAVLGLPFLKDIIFGLKSAELDGEEYLAGAVDPVAHFTAPIAVQTTVLRP